MALKESLLAKIQQSLEKLCQIYAAILASSREMQAHIVKGDAQAVGEDVQQQRELMGQLSVEEDTRMQAVAMLAAEMSMPEESLTLSRISELAGGEKGAGLAKTGAELARMAGEQQAINVQNKDLLELQMEYMNFMIDNFLREPQINNIYGNNGVLQEEEDLHAHVDSEV